jgi:hypothetical protein
MAMTLITTNTSSNAATSSFTSSIDSTYKLYIFKFIDINPATDTANFQFDCSTDGGSNYGMTKTSTFFETTHYDDNSNAYGPSYSTDGDLAQDTAFQYLASALGNATDECSAGTLWLFNPSNTTYVKHFYSRIAENGYADLQRECQSAGYVNSTSDIDAVQFKMSSGNFDGVIKMYGVG